MAFFDFFRRKPPVADAATLAEFIDTRAAFLVQKGIYEFSRARAGHYAKALFSEQPFLDAVEQSRWQAYPIGLAMVAEIVDGVLYPHVATDRHEVLGVLTLLVLDVFDRYPVPETLGRRRWRELRGELQRRLQHIGIHQPKPVKDIPEQFAESYYSLMPIHEKLRKSDFPTLRNYLKVVACGIHDQLVKRIDLPAVLASLRNHEHRDAASLVSH